MNPKKIGALLFAFRVQKKEIMSKLEVGQVLEGGDDMSREIFCMMLGHQT